MRLNILFFTLFFVIAGIGYLISEPGFNGTAPGCSGSSCHSQQSGIVTATILPGNQVRITVTGNTGNVAGELVNSNGTVVAVMGATSSNPFILTAPSSGSYTVNAGYKSPSRVYGTTTANIAAAPSAPTFLNSSAFSNTQINLSWTDNSADENGFIIERKTTTGGVYSEIAQVGSNVTTFNNTSLLGGTQYCYRVSAFNTAGNSGYSNESCASTFPNAPAAPSNLIASVIQSPLSVQLNWTDNSDNESGFIIEKENTGGTFSVLDTTSSNITTFQDNGVSVATYRYRVKAFNITGSSAYSNISEIFVPVELVSFTVQNVNGTITLNWRTATELNNKGFDVQRKDRSSSGWLTIGFINGKGTSTEESDYIYSDIPPSEGKYKYRLKQMDFSGKFEYSDEIEIEYISVKEWKLAQNYPNPFNPETMIEFSVPGESRVTLKVYNVLGKEVAALVDERKNRGVYNISFDASGLPSGMYFYKISAEGFEQTRKMLLMK